MAEEAKLLNKLISECKIQRGVIKGQQTKMKTYVETKAENANEFELETKLGLLESHFTNFNTLQSKLESVDPQEQDSSDREQFEDIYFEIKSRLLFLINEKKPRKSITLDSTNFEGSQHITTPKVDHVQKLKLPTFSGELIEWLDFWSVFKTLIHENSKYGAIEKFQHLRNCLTGKAKEVVRSMEITSENYTEAIDLLKSRYENKRYIFQEHINSIFQLESIGKSSVENLRFMIDRMKANMRSLLTIGDKEQIADGLLLHILVSKLDATTQAKWEEDITNKLETASIDSQPSTSSTVLKEKKSFTSPKWDEFSDFLEKRLRTLEILEANRNHQNSSPSTKSQHEPSRYKPKVSHSNRYSLVSSPASPRLCIFCSQPEHSLFRCQKLQDMTPKARYNEAKRLKVCINCLKSGHLVKFCQSTKCQKCSGNHHTLLHMSSESEIVQQQLNVNGQTCNFANNSTQNNAEQCNSQSQTLITANSFHISDSSSTSKIFKHTRVILPTALVHIFDSNGTLVTCRALLDSASQSHFVSEALVKRLNLQKSNMNIPISGIGNVNTSIEYKTKLRIKSLNNNFSANLEALVIPRITGEQPDRHLNTDNLQIPKNIRLADPSFNKPQQIDLLIGADLFFSLLCVGQIRLGNDAPILQKTLLGWIVSGNIVESSSYSFHINLANQPPVNEDIDTILKGFWEIENASAATKIHNTEEVACEDHYLKTTKRDNSGRYIVKLPFRENPSILGDSYQIALKRFEMLERRLSKDPGLKEEYSNFIDEYLKLKHMEEISITQLPQNNYFLPHHCVIKQDSSTTQVRVVFDGSCRTSSGKSLNDVLMVGPTVQDDLFLIILRFRLHRFVVTADIVKMYRQFLVEQNHTNFQCILWRNTSDEPIRVFRLRTVTYGTASAAYLAIRSLVQLARDEATTFPLGSKSILENFYVDNFMGGADTLEELLNIKKEVTNLLMRGGLPLRKWCSNVQDIIADIPMEDREKYLQINNNNVIKTLGLMWHPTTDYFSFHVKIPINAPITKRAILSEIAKFYDPLGLINPIIVLAKIFMQHLWKLKLEWDESLPIELQTKWCKFREQLSVINDIKIPRYVIQTNSEIEVHAFADASEKAYGACIYLRSIETTGKITVRLLCAKSKVAPIHTTSLPRLELCAAVLLAELIARIRTSLPNNINKYFCWTDSTIALAWIKSPSYQWSTFISNRTSKIQELTDKCIWNHVPTEANTADIVSRGSLPKDLQNSTLWFNGPEFLKLSSSHWPTMVNTVEEVPEKRKTCFSFVTILKHTDLISSNKFANSYFRLLLVFVYVRRFYKKANRRAGAITPNELDEALKVIIRNIQMIYFAHDYRRLEQNKPITVDSRLRSLSPFMDNERIIRVGGRIKHSDLPEDAKHQILLPQSHPFTEELIRYHHLKNFHSGCQTLLNIIRQRFWIISGKSAIRKVIHKCIICFRSRPTIAHQIMRNLPADRLHPSRPFSITSVDYCGPVYVSSKIRGRAPVKSYIAVFVCFSTKAVHLELVTDLTTSAFLLALKRFIARRGKCSKIYSDNATNFLGAKNELRELRQLFLSEHHNNIVRTFCLEDGIQWLFIPPRSPHFGGLWESAVKIAKSHLLKVILNVFPTFEEMDTFVCQVEAIMNSRPISQISTDPQDLQPLTPGHFLIGAPLVAINEPNITDIHINRIHRKRIVEHLHQQFWKRFRNEYLHTLQQKGKWNTSSKNLAVGDLVLLKEESTPSMKWPICRVIELHTGEDDHVRVVTIRTASGIYKRAISQLCCIPKPEVPDHIERGSFQGRRHVQSSQ